MTDSRFTGITVQEEPGLFSYNQRVYIGRNHREKPQGGIVSILNAVMGNASEVEVEEIEKEFSQILIEDEKLVRVFKLVRDLFAFTDRRLILVDKQGISGKKTEYHSIPYKSIAHFSFETAGRIDLDSEMKVWISGNVLPVKKEFKKGIDVTDVQRTLAKFTLG